MGSNTVSTRHTSLTTCFLSLPFGDSVSASFHTASNFKKKIHGLLPVALTTSTCSRTSSFLHSYMSLGPACAVSWRRVGTPSVFCVAMAKMNSQLHAHTLSSLGHLAHFRVLPSRWPRLPHQQPASLYCPVRFLLEPLQSAPVSWARTSHRVSQRTLRKRDPPLRWV